VANIFILSKLWHLATIIPLSKPFLQKVETLAFHFIWKIMEKLQRTVVFNIYSAGGLGVFHIPSRLAAFAIKHPANYIYIRNKRWVPFADYWLAIHLRNFLPPGSVRSGARTVKGTNTYYTAAIKNLETFIERGGSLADSTIMVRIAYRSLLATVVTQPKAIIYAPTDRFVVWKKLRAKHFSPNVRNILWQISHNILPVKIFLKERNVTKDAMCAVCEDPLTHTHVGEPFHKWRTTSRRGVTASRQNFIRNSFRI
jgi:hypothetical protein